MTASLEYELAAALNQVRRIAGLPALEKAYFMSSEHLAQQITETLSNFPVSGEQRIRLLGPTRINFDTPNITSGFISVISLEAGMTVLAVRLEVVELLDVDADTAQIRVNVVGAAGGGADIRRYLVGDSYGADVDADTAPETSFYVGQHPGEPFTEFDVLAGPFIFGSGAHRIITAGSVRVRAFNTAGAVRGAADIYALIAEPVAG